VVPVLRLEWYRVGCQYLHGSLRCKVMDSQGAIDTSRRTNAFTKSEVTSTLALARSLLFRQQSRDTQAATPCSLTLLAGTTPSLPSTVSATLPIARLTVACKTGFPTSGRLRIPRATAKSQLAQRLARSSQASKPSARSHLSRLC